MEGEAPPVGAQEAADARAAAKKIVDGHAYSKHANQFPGLTRDAFEEQVVNVIMNFSERRLLGDGRLAYWSDAHAMLVIVDGRTKDGGSAFRPRSGKEYFYKLR